MEISMKAEFQFFLFSLHFFLVVSNEIWTMRRSTIDLIDLKLYLSSPFSTEEPGNLLIVFLPAKSIFA